jgi:hypothetical protein
MVNMKIPLDINNTLNASSNEIAKQIDENAINMKQQSTPTTPRSSSFDFNTDFANGNSDALYDTSKIKTNNSLQTNTNTISLRKLSASFSKHKSSSSKAASAAPAATTTSQIPLSNSNTLFTNLEDKRSIMDENSMEKSINEYNHDDLSSSASLKIKTNETYSNSNNHNNNNKDSNYSYSIGEAGYNVWKFVSKFVDRVCIEGNLNNTQRQSLHNNLTEVISMQIQMLETVCIESKRVPIRTKPKFDILKPDYMLNGEHFIEPTPLRCHLVPDGREEACGISNGGAVLLPAEGALFLTNYRLIFRGIPINDCLMNESVITRSFPVSALIKEKKIGSQYRVNSNFAANNIQSMTNSNLYKKSNLSNSHKNLMFSNLHDLHDGLQMRSSTFQLIKVFFDEDVSNEKIDRFRHALLKIRYPPSVLDFFCFGSTNLFNLLNNGQNSNAYEIKADQNPEEIKKFLKENELDKKDFYSECNSSEYGMDDRNFYPSTISIKNKEKHSETIRFLFFLNKII